jgi:hypothetical protein
MAVSTCYAAVRGSAIRVTGLSARGSVPSPVQYAASKAVAKVTINEVTESGSSEALGSEENDNDIRLRLQRSEETIRYTVDMDFLKVDPGVFNLITGVPLVRAFSDGTGFGEMTFGEDSFGEGAVDAPGSPSEIRGFDSVTRLSPVSFGLEVWSRLAGQVCGPSISVGFDEGGFDMGGFGGVGDVGGNRDYGYTLFPHLRGGRLGGFTFSNGLVSFNIRGAQTRKAPRWNVGPYDLEGPYMRLVTPVSRNTMFRQTLTVAPPPTDHCGIQETTDVLDGRTATVTTEDIVDGGTAAETSEWIVEGGMAL